MVSASPVKYLRPFRFVSGGKCLSLLWWHSVIFLGWQMSLTAVFILVLRCAVVFLQCRVSCTSGIALEATT